ncbi:unnamed protein product, partial [Gadus morhua 'NCC']
MRDGGTQRALLAATGRQASIPDRSHVRYYASPHPPKNSRPTAATPTTTQPRAHPPRTPGASRPNGHPTAKHPTTTGHPPRTNRDNSHEQRFQKRPQWELPSATAAGGYWSTDPVAPPTPALYLRDTLTPWTDVTKDHRTAQSGLGVPLSHWFPCSSSAEADWNETGNTASAAEAPLSPPLRAPGPGLRLRSWVSSSATGPPSGLGVERGTKPQQETAPPPAPRGPLSPLLGAPALQRLSRHRQPRDPLQRGLSHPPCLQQWAPGNEGPGAEWRINGGPGGRAAAAVGGNRGSDVIRRQFLSDSPRK